VFGAGALTVALLALIGLAWGAARSGPSPTAVLLLAPMLVLLPLILWLAYWTWAYWTLRYEVGRDGLILHWAGARQVVPMGEITHVLNRASGSPRSGLRWPGWSTGRDLVQDEAFGEREAIVLATAPVDDQMLVVTRALAYAISPDDPKAFADEFKRRRALGSTQVLDERTHPPRWARLSLANDRVAQGLLATAVLICVLAFAWLTWHYPQLPGQLALRYRFDAAAGATIPGAVAPLNVAWRLPSLGLLALVANLFLALRIHADARLAARLMLVGSVLVQLALAVALLRAI
jgi:hypothetical protein